MRSGLRLPGDTAPDAARRRCGPRGSRVGGGLAGCAVLCCADPCCVFLSCQRLLCYPAPPRRRQVQRRTFEHTEKHISQRRHGEGEPGAQGAWACSLRTCVFAAAAGCPASAFCLCLAPTGCPRCLTCLPPPIQSNEWRAVNVVEGIELHCGVLTAAEQARVAAAVEHWVELVSAGAGRMAVPPGDAHGMQGRSCRRLRPPHATHAAVLPAPTLPPPSKPSIPVPPRRAARATCVAAPSAPPKSGCPARGASPSSLAAATTMPRTRRGGSRVRARALRRRLACVGGCLLAAPADCTPADRTPAGPGSGGLLATDSSLRRSYSATPTQPSARPALPPLPCQASCRRR